MLDFVKGVAQILLAPFLVDLELPLPEFDPLIQGHRMWPMSLGILGKVACCLITHINVVA